MYLALSSCSAPGSPVMRAITSPMGVGGCASGLPSSTTGEGTLESCRRGGGGIVLAGATTATSVVDDANFSTWPLALRAAACASTRPSSASAWRIR